MALIQCGFYSETLGFATSMNVIVPQPLGGARADGAAGKRIFPVLYLLHGLTDDHTAWLRYSSVERYAAARGLAVVMPEAHRSFYSDMDRYRRYWTFVSEELPTIAEALFPVADSRRQRYAAGLSMGGYGALKLALGRPDRYYAAASLSGVTDLGAIGSFMGDEAEMVYGGQPPAGSDGDLFELARRVADSDGPRPLFYQCCGTEDELYGENVRFRDHAAGLGLNLHYEEEPGGHEWDYWDRNIRRVIDWLPLGPDAGPAREES